MFLSPTGCTKGEWSPAINLHWTEHELLNLMDIVVASAGGTAQYLSDLVEIGDPSLSEEEFLLEALKYARGSFERALTIGQRALNHHLAGCSHPSDLRFPFLSNHDLIAALLGA